MPKPAPLTTELRKLIFRLTQGILAVFIALHRASQVYAIRRGMVTVDAAVLREVYGTQFTLLHPALNALQSNKRTRLEKFEDLLPPKDQMNTLLRPSNEEALLERIQHLFAAAQDPGAESKTLGQPTQAGLSPSQSDTPPEGLETSNEAVRAAAQFLAQIGSNAELKELARRAGLFSEEGKEGGQ